MVYKFLNSFNYTPVAKSIVWPFLSVTTAFLKPFLIPNFPLTIFVLGLLFIVFILITEVYFSQKIGLKLFTKAHH